MRTRIPIFAAVFILWTFANSSAQERYVGGIPTVATTQDKHFAGEVVVSPMLVNFEGQKAKFNEYRDLRDGVYGAVALKYDSDRYYLDFGAADIGYKTQRYELDGGRWGTGKFHLGFDELPHNFTFGAKSFYRGIGGGNLGATFPVNRNLSTWSTFDYSIDRRNYEAGFKFDAFKPFFFDVTANKVEKKGVYPIGVAGTSPGGPGIELPMPINYTTNNLKLEAGYSSSPLFLSFSYLYSEFENDHSNLNFTNVATANTAAPTDTFTLPHDNTYYKLNFKGGVKLPFNSKFNADIATSRTQSDAKLLNSYVSDTTALASNIGVRGLMGIGLSDFVFNGKIDTQNYAFSLTTNPIYFLDAKVFYKYYRRENKNDVITTTDRTQTPASFTNDVFSYYKEQGGAQVGFTLPAKFYLSGGYTQVYTKREERLDIPTNTDRIYTADLRWTGVDWMVARVGYEHLHREADFRGPVATGTDLAGGPSAADVANIETFLRRFDVAARDRNLYKATIDFFPVENLSVSIGGKYKKTDYKGTILGLRNDRRSEFTFDADYLILNRVRLFANFDYERVKMDQQQRQLSLAGPAGGQSTGLITGFSPSLPPIVSAPTGTAATGSGNFNWTASSTDYNYGYGVGTDIYIIPQKVTLRLQYSAMKNDGTVDYTYMLSQGQLSTLAPGRTNSNIDVANWDRYRLQYYLAKVTYIPIKPLSISLAYAYEKYTYNDVQYNGYQNIPTGPTGTVLDYLTGAYANPNYKANIFFLSAAYQF